MLQVGELSANALCSHFKKFESKKSVESASESKLCQENHDLIRLTFETKLSLEVAKQTRPSK